MNIFNLKPADDILFISYYMDYRESERRYKLHKLDKRSLPEHLACWQAGDDIRIHDFTNSTKNIYIQNETVAIYRPRKSGNQPNSQILIERNYDFPYGIILSYKLR